MKFERFVALRYLTRRKGLFAIITTLIGVAGVSVGVAALITTLSVMNGFQTDIKEKVIGAQSHILVFGRMPAGAYEEHIKQIEQIPLVEAAAPHIYGQAILSYDGQSVGLVVRGLSNPFYSDIIKVIGRRIDEAGYTMVMQQIDSTEDEIQCGAVMEREKKLRGLIFLGGRSDYTAGQLGTITVPFVCCSYDNSFGTLPPQRLSTVSIDDCNTAYRAVSELIALGHRRIAALVAATDDRSISELRCRGYLSALRDHGIEPDPALVACTGSFGMEDAYRATRALCAAGADFTAMFIIADAMAIAAIKALEDTGRDVPRDCSVIAVDGLALSQYTRPTLTTMCQPSDRMGEESVRILLDMIERRAGNRSLVLESTLRAGASVAPPDSRR